MVTRPVGVGRKAGETDERQIEAEGLCGLQVEHQLVLGRRLHRQVGGLLPLENPYVRLKHLGIHPASTCEPLPSSQKTQCVPISTPTKSLPRARRAHHIGSCTSARGKASLPPRSPTIRACFSS